MSFFGGKMGNGIEVYEIEECPTGGYYIDENNNLIKKELDGSVTIVGNITLSNLEDIATQVVEDETTPTKALLPGGLFLFYKKYH